MSYSAERSISLPDLAQYTERNPQRDSQGQLRWLLSCGWTVQLVTGFVREHSDIDIVVINSQDSRRLLTQGERIHDFARTIRRGLTHLSIDYLCQTAVKTLIPTEPEGVEAMIVHPGITLVHKFMNAADLKYGIPLRPKDVDDARALVRKMRDNPEDTEGWMPVIHTALGSIQFPTQQQAIRNQISILFQEEGVTGSIH